MLKLCKYAITDTFRKQLTCEYGKIGFNCPKDSGVNGENNKECFQYIIESEQINN